MTTDVDVLNELFASGVVSVFGDVFTLAGIMVVLLWMDWRLALVTFSVLPAMFWIYPREYTDQAAYNAGAGRAIEIVPLLNGQEPLNDPLFFDVSGNYGMEFSYDTSPNYLGTTAALINYDACVINLTLDYALN